ncbi:MAG: tRNA 2-selenouridine(34) synthase MnmH [Synechococcales bacterium]|nr:tRNA 2-selenouridine(34) synthase MnmH [Synechococcales bacterium]
MPIACDVPEFLAAPGILLDTRSPAEFAAGHIPGAVSFPLFDNAERAEVGTCYKQVGAEAAIELGLERVAPKMVKFVQQAKQLAGDRQVRLHCWRGGMRSSSMAWLLETAGLKVALLTGGYKAFRRWVRASLAEPKPIITLGGMTGTGKTEILYGLAAVGEQILDLEKYAHHRGSSYGALGLPPQPSQEQFENEVAIAWRQLEASRRIWIEAESRRIGLCRVPDEIFQPMLSAPILQIDRSRAERIAILVKDYGKLDRQELITATTRISKRIGGQNEKVAVEAIQQGDLETAIAIVLDYYDKTYLYDLQRRNVSLQTVDVNRLTIDAIVDKLIDHANQLKV